MSESQPALTSKVLTKAIRGLKPSNDIPLEDVRRLRFLSKPRIFERACPGARAWAAGKVAQLSTTVNP